MAQATLDHFWTLIETIDVCMMATRDSGARRDCGKSDPDIAVIRVAPSRAEYWDF